MRRRVYGGLERDGLGLGAQPIELTAQALCTALVDGVDAPVGAIQDLTGSAAGAGEVRPRLLTATLDRLAGLPLGAEDPCNGLIDAVFVTKLLIQGAALPASGADPDPGGPAIHVPRHRVG